jgi:membrane protein involved in colicin uptake
MSGAAGLVKHPKCASHDDVSAAKAPAKPPAKAGRITVPAFVAMVFASAAGPKLNLSAAEIAAIVGGLQDEQGTVNTSDAVQAVGDAAKRKQIERQKAELEAQNKAVREVMARRAAEAEARAAAAEAAGEDSYAPAVDDYYDDDENDGSSSDEEDGDSNQSDGIDDGSDDEDDGSDDEEELSV